MFTVQTIMLAAIILGLLIWAASLSLRMNNALSKAKAMEAKLDVSESMLVRHHKESSNNLRAAARQQRLLNAEVNRLTRKLKGAQSIKMITFQTSQTGMKRFAVGHDVERLNYANEVDAFTVYKHLKNGGVQTIEYARTDIVGALTIERRD